ncbi:MAG: SUMF1/EgtB/PvdO family nonheme iron enzyme [Anaerolineae bacterium]|nr:SUMF1/EgtB/PvdO family nonheme iron enzyme [Anaerolineae bacterium]
MIPKKDAGRLYDRLVSEFGKENVFKDVDNIPVGQDFREVLTDWVSRSDVMLVLIGSKWLTLKDADGTPRINNPSDFVHYEVNLGLRSSSVTVIPVIVAPASPPLSTQLPEALREVAFLNAAFVRDDPDFHHDVSRLIKSLQAIPPNTDTDSKENEKSWWGKLTEGQGAVIASFVGAVAVIIAAIIGFYAVVLPLINQTDVTPEAPTAVVQGGDTTETVVPPSATATATPSDTPTATQTLSATEVEASIRAEMLVIQTEERQTQSANETATQQSLQIAEQSTADSLTVTATLWTYTPTADIRATAEARSTRDAQATIDMQATLNAQNTATQVALNAQGTATQDALNAQGTQQAIDATATAENDPLALAQRGVTSNADWERFSPVVQEFNGVEMVLVPSGCFDMGSENGASDEQPINEVCFEASFWIDRYEVSNGQFEQLGGVAGRSSNWTGDNLPRENITWFEARDFCELRDARLPTEAEWEYAARGVDEWVYPWGDGFVAENTVYGNNSGGQTAIVGSRPSGVSWVGAFDMAGNVWEWTNSLYLDYPYDVNDGRESNSDNAGLRVVRGGSFFNSTFGLRAANRRYGNLSNVFTRFGFRCVRS